MAKLNLQNAIRKGAELVDWRYALSLTDVKELYKKGGVETVLDSFNVGYLQGYKAAKAEIKRATV